MWNIFCSFEKLKQWKQSLFSYWSLMVKTGNELMMRSGLRGASSFVSQVPNCRTAVQVLGRPMVGWSFLKKTKIRFEVNRLRSELRMDQKCPQQKCPESSRGPQTNGNSHDEPTENENAVIDLNERSKRSVTDLLKTRSIENTENSGLKCYPCQKSSLFITQEVSYCLS